MKKCTECKKEKNDVGKNGKCKICNTEYMRQYRLKNKNKIKKYQQEYDAKYYQNNKKNILEAKQKYYQENKKEILLDRKDYYQKHKKEKQKYNKFYYKENKIQLIYSSKKYAKENPVWLKDYHNKYYKARRINDSNFRIRTSISANINFYLKNNNSSKNGHSCLNYLLYTIQELKKHLENLFEPWMTWSNYGRYNSKTWDDNDSSTWTWQIDHIIPQSKLLYSSMSDDNFKKCWSLDNLRPLSSKQNFLDGINRIRH